MVRMHLRSPCLLLIPSVLTSSFTFHIFGDMTHGIMQRGGHDGIRESYPSCFSFHLSRCQ